MKPETRNMPGRKRCKATNITWLQELQKNGELQCCRKATHGDYCYQHYRQKEAK